jgi:hypothetical protein
MIPTPISDVDDCGLPDPRLVHRTPQRVIRADQLNVVNACDAREYRPRVFDVSPSNCTRLLIECTRLERVV